MEKSQLVRLARLSEVGIASDGLIRARAAEKFIGKPTNHRRDSKRASLIVARGKLVSAVIQYADAPTKFLRQLLSEAGKASEF